VQATPTGAERNGNQDQHRAQVKIIFKEMSLKIKKMDDIKHFVEGFIAIRCNSPMVFASSHEKVCDMTMELYVRGCNMYIKSQSDREHVYDLFEGWFRTRAIDRPREAFRDLLVEGVDLGEVALMVARTMVTVLIAEPFDEFFKELNSRGANLQKCLDYVLDMKEVFDTYKHARTSMDLFTYRVRDVSSHIHMYGAIVSMIEGSLSDDQKKVLDEALNWDSLMEEWWTDSKLFMTGSVFARPTRDDQDNFIGMCLRTMKAYGNFWLRRQKCQ
jgi:hypothetical protein